MNIKGRPCGPRAQLAECSHGKREALGSSPGRATMFSSPVIFTKYLLNVCCIVYMKIIKVTLNGKFCCFPVETGNSKLFVQCSMSAYFSPYVTAE